MRPITVTAGPILSAGNIFNNVPATKGQPLTLNGSLVSTDGVAYLNPPQSVQISGGSGQFTVVGTGPTGTPQSETLYIDSVSTQTNSRFATVKSVTPLFQPAGNVSGGTPWTSVTSSMIRLDEWADAPIGVQVATSGTVNFTVQHSFDDPNDLANPVPPNQMFWDTGLVPAGAIGGTAGISFAIATAPLWMRISLSSGSGTVRMTVAQYNNVEE